MTRNPKAKLRHAQIMVGKAMARITRNSVNVEDRGGARYVPYYAMQELMYWTKKASKAQRELNRRKAKS